LAGVSHYVFLLNDSAPIAPVPPTVGQCDLCVGIGRVVLFFGGQFEQILIAAFAR